MKTEPNEPINAIVEDNNYEGQLIREARFNGLTKREYFAGLAMQGLLSNLSDIRRDGFKDSEISEYARMQADLLINELNK